MATYVVLATLTDQGVRTMHDLQRRLDNARQTFAAFGAELKHLYFAMGTYDYVVIAEAPDDETMTRVSLAVSSQGNVRTNSFRVFTEEEALRIVEAIP
ncbi:MAG TPA: GYD domain-containing protein [Vicinamibacterales bacterium]|nr:GYD domain-containing protein [Vicinamibacterales bacterium]